MTDSNATLSDSSGASGALAVSVSAAAAAPPTFTPDQIVTQLTTSWGVGENYTAQWQPGTISYSFDSQAYDTAAVPEQAGFSTMSAVMQDRANYAFQSWQDLVSGVTLLQVSSPTAANISFNYSGQTTNGGTYTDLTLTNGASNTYQLSHASIWLSSTWPTQNQDSDLYYGGYGLETYLHEIGHALGLSHPGNYDADTGAAVTFAANAVFAQDNRQYSVMSYFGGYDASIGGWTQDGTQSNWGYAETPMVYDILAIQQKYGANYNTRSGDTVYGYNSNLNDFTGQVFNMADNPLPIYSVWDGGGHDTFDWSGYGGNQVIDLTPGHYSSVAGLSNNVGIAFGVTIEDAKGGAGNDILIGNAADNVLNGGAGADSMAGGAGNDTYYVDNRGDVVLEYANQGTDTIISSINHWGPLEANVENLTLTGSAQGAVGNSLSNVITGDSLGNYLNGGAGAGPDTLIGGDGSDWYVVHNAGDVIIETPTGGNADFVTADISYVLPANVEQLWMQGTANINGTGNAGDNGIVGNSGDNTLDGGSGNDWLLGGAGNDTLIGGPGNDWLDGGTGADTMSGGIGNDIYIVDNIGDVIIENSGEGTDAVAAYVSYTLPANVEQLWLQGTGAVTGTGNSGDNGLVANLGNDVLDGQGGNDWLVGGSGADTLIGGAGDDTLVAGSGVTTMVGGTGNDAYVVNNAADVITEQPGEGNDSVASSVSYILPANVENLYFSQNTLDLTGIGNASDNLLEGNNGANVLSGLGGNDALIGLGGNDTLTGGLGHDVFIFNPGLGDSIITDFTHGGANGDTLDLSALFAAGDTVSAPALAANGTDTVFTITDAGQPHTITLQTVLPGALTPSADFHFYT